MGGPGVQALRAAVLAEAERSLKSNAEVAAQWAALFTPGVPQDLAADIDKQRQVRANSPLAVLFDFGHSFGAATIDPTPLVSADDDLSKVCFRYAPRVATHQTVVHEASQIGSRNHDRIGLAEELKLLRRLHHLLQRRASQTGEVEL
jgi:hypothetical protein